MLGLSLESGPWVGTIVVLESEVGGLDSFYLQIISLRWSDTPKQLDVALVCRMDRRGSKGG